jgi:hypothetical protein
MNVVVLDTVRSVVNLFMGVGNALHRGLVCSGRTRAAQELTKLGYHEQAITLMLENQNQH